MTVSARGLTTRSTTFLAILLCAISPLAAQTLDSVALDSILDSSLEVFDDMVLILVRDGGVEYSGTAGDVNITTWKYVGSGSKWLAAAAFMTLVDEGLVSLDDTVGEYLETFTGEKGSITLRQCWSHTSGLPMQSEYIENQDLTLEQAVDSVGLNLELVNSPGTVFDYGAVSMQVAGRIAEIVTGQTWAELFEERITEPCEMVSVGWGESDNPLIAGGARICALDYARFVLMILQEGDINGNQVLSEQSVAEMSSDQIEDVTIGYSPELPGYEDFDYGIGNWTAIDYQDDWDEMELMSPGVFGSIPWVNRNRDYAGILLTFKWGEESESWPFFHAIREVTHAAYGYTEVEEAGCPVNLPVSPQLVYTCPNPFNSSIGIGVAVPAPGSAGLEVFDITGRRVATLHEGLLGPGYHTFKWRADNRSSGIYFVRLNASGGTQTVRIALIR